MDADEKIKFLPNDGAILTALSVRFALIEIWRVDKAPTFLDVSFPMRCR